MKKPYIGITGFMSLDEAIAVLRSMPVSAGRVVMVGVLASQKTMRGIQNKWPNRYPKMEKIAGIFPNHPLALNLIHYHTKEQETLYEQLLKMTGFGGDNLHGFQLNVAWPSPSALKKYRLAYPTMQIVLQIGARAFEMVKHSPKKLAAKVAKEYDELIDYVLLDPSGGYGKPFNTERARKYLTELKAKKLNAGLGVAGGLSPNTLGLVEPLTKDFPDLSIDAEGRLRNQNDSLNLNIAEEYIRKALKTFDSAK